MVIHPREQDLVIGTFGRSAYIIDDIRPLRALAREHDKITSSALYPVEPPEAYLADTKNEPGYYFSGDAYFKGKNRPWGARISYFATVEEEEGKEKKDTVTIRVLDQENKLVRTLKSVPENGLNRTGWYLDRKGVRVSFSEKGGNNSKKETGGGGSVLPGTYSLQFAYQGDTALSKITVEADPRRDYDMEGMKAKEEKTDELLEKLSELKEALTSIRECRESYELVKKLTGTDVSDGLKEAAKVMEEELDRISKLVFRDESIQGIYYPSDALFVRMGGTYGITGSDTPLTVNQEMKHARYMEIADETIGIIDRFMESQWRDYEARVEEEDISLLDRK
jgi:hypothetical protein